MVKLHWLALLLVLSLGIAYSCDEGTTGGGSRAYQVVDRSTLIGGPMALGDLGDFLIENSRVRLTISKAGISRAFGLFGGNIIDADRVRAGVGRGGSQGGRGFDSLVEMFPLFFLGAIDPKSTEILSDGKDGKAAGIRVKGEGASFIALTESINNFVTFPDGKNRLAFQVDYRLPPGKDYIEITVRVTNNQEKVYRFGNILGKKIPSVTGMVGLFGKRNKVFIPGIAGYNIRFSLEKIFETKLNAPAIPGLIGDFVASWGQNGVSYGLVAEASPENYVLKQQEEFKKLGIPISERSLIVPMEGSSITAAFTKMAPYSLKQGQSFEYKLYMVVGDGSVGSIRNAQLDIHKRPKGLFGGQVVEEKSYRPIPDAHVILYTGGLPKDGSLPKPGDRMFYTDLRTDARGNFQGYLEPGTYSAIVRSGRMVSKPVTVEIKKDQRHFKQLTLPQPGVISFVVRDQKGRLVPAKVMVLGLVSDFVYEGKKGGCVGQGPVYCMFDPHIGEGKIDTDFKVGLTCSDGSQCAGHVNCTGKGDGKCAYRLAGKTEYREAVAYSATGLGTINVRPGRYRIVASRGIEYELGEETGVEVRPGNVSEVTLTIVHSVPTPKSVSIDFHVHSNFSHDVSISDRSRVASFAGEGVDTYVTTDHNRIRDMMPIVLSLRLERWLKTFIGVELTTFEMGHINAFPLKLDATAFNGGNPDWFKEQDKRYKDDQSFPITDKTKRPIQGLRLGVPPAEMFARLRQRGSLCDNDRNCPKTVIQVNHPRDSIFGYFNAFSVDPDSGFPLYKKPGIFDNPTQPLSREFDADNYSNNFNAIEIFNGSRFDLMWHWRLPPKATVPAGHVGIGGNKVRINNEGRADIAYPGGVDDWFNLLNRGFTMAATANSDSHNHEPEAGFPRSYLLTGFDDPQQLTPDKMADLVLKKKVMLTNGPILEVQAKGPDGTLYDMGDTLPIQGGGNVTFVVKVRAASWVDVSELNVYKNGKLARTINIPESTKPERFSKELVFEVKDADAWFVFAVKGQKGLWPVLRSEEVEPFQIGTAVGLIQDALLGSLPFDLGSSSASCLLPSIIRVVFPYAMSNPFWIDVDGDKKYTPQPCKTLGDKGVRCAAKGTACDSGYCLDPGKQCLKDEDCTQTDKTQYSRCIKGSCSVDPCVDVTCASDTKPLVCTDKTPCPLDQCPEKDRRCKDGTPCSKDSDCAGKGTGVGDNLCRYCACPNARKACEDGTACTSDKDCASGSCTSQRLCPPTACSLGHCLPTYPTCTPEQQTQSAHLFLQPTKKTLTQLPQTTGLQKKTATLRINLLKPTQPGLSKDANKALNSLSIRKARAYFLFFEHKH